jgi:hypothetical protein
MSPKRYLKAITFGRYNLPHKGHIDLIKGMLTNAEIAEVYVSTGKANNDWDCRVLVLKHLCLRAYIDLKRVRFLKSNSPYTAVEEAVKGTHRGSNVLMLGTDQQALLQALGVKFICGTIINPRICSSTQVRHLIDDCRFADTLSHLYDNDDFILTAVKILRKQEIVREESFQTATETCEVACGDACVEHYATEKRYVGPTRPR